MSDEGRLEIDPLFQGLTRPAMILGVTYNYFLINLIVCMVYYIWNTSFFALFVVAPLVHLFGYWICLREPRTLELIQTRMSMCTKCKFPNWKYHHRTHSYDVF